METTPERSKQQTAVIANAATLAAEVHEKEVKRISKLTKKQLLGEVRTAARNHQLKGRDFALATALRVVLGDNFVHGSGRRP